ncbi:hypothetical protein AAG906_003386 [Vitis piasezkii]
MIRKLSDFRWPEPLKTDSAKRDRNRKCVYHKEHEHTTEQCRSLYYLVEKLVRAKHLRQYVCSEGKNGVTSRSPTTTTPIASTAPRVVINYIHGGPIDEEYNSKQKKQRLLQATCVREQVSSIKPRLISRSMRSIDGKITFPLVDSNLILQPHRDTLILSLGISDFDVRWILVDLGSSVDLLQVSVIKHMGFSPSNMENPGRILLGFNGASTMSLGDIVLPVQTGPIALNVQFSIVEDLSPFNTILGAHLAARHENHSFYLLLDGELSH